VVFLLLVALVRCSDEPIAQVIKVQAFRSGEFSLDGKRVTLEEARRYLADLKAANVVVWYYREGSDSDPTDAPFELVKAIVDAKLSISLSSKEDFSDYVGADGRSYPRTE
jgi:hypothetical protein